MKPSALVALFAVSLCAWNVQAEEGPRTGELYETLARMDRQLFEAAFVECDAEAFRDMFTEDAEFYHDLAGPSFGEKARTLNGCPADNGVRRVLVPGSLEVYPMKDFGAIQMGEHWFVEEGAKTSTLAKFVTLWRLQDGRWRMARVLSFDHQSKPRIEGPR
jgi:hypothetical protein